MNIISFFDTIHCLDTSGKLALSAIVHEKKYKKNEIIQELGSTCRTIYFVKSGIARIFYFKNGNDITEHFAFDNDIIVRAESLFTGKSASKGIQAINATTVYAIDAPSLFHLYDTHHDIERLFRLLIEKEYIATVKRIESLQFKTAKERYQELTLTTNYVQKIALKHISTYLGVTQVSISRIRNEIVKSSLPF